MSQIRESGQPDKKLQVDRHAPDRPDGADKVTGRARFGADFNLPGQLVGKVLRSPHAHAIIKSIDTSKAEALPGVKAVITRARLPRPAQPDRADRRDAGRTCATHAQRHGAREGALRGPSGGRGRRDVRGDRQAGAGADQGRVRGAAARHRRRRGDEARRADPARPHAAPRAPRPPADQAVEHRQAHRVQQGRRRGRASPRPTSIVERDLHHAGRAPGLHRAARHAAPRGRGRPGRGLVRPRQGHFQVRGFCAKLLGIETSQIRVHADRDRRRLRRQDRVLSRAAGDPLCRRSQASR